MNQKIKKIKPNFSTEVVNLSSDDESIANYVKKSKVISSNSWPRFLVIGSGDDKALKMLSPFAIQ